jgi:hypothetical protein
MVMTAGVVIAGLGGVVLAAAGVAARNLFEGVLGLLALALAVATGIWRARTSG